LGTSSPPIPGSSSPLSLSTSGPPFRGTSGPSSLSSSSPPFLGSSGPPVVLPDGSPEVRPRSLLDGLPPRARRCHQRSAPGSARRSG
ncbi:hypothetical protein AB0A93_32735, partial [Streptomyces sp. NPDC045369]